MLVGFETIGLGLGPSLGRGGPFCSMPLCLECFLSCPRSLVASPHSPALPCTALTCAISYMSFSLAASRRFISATSSCAPGNGLPKSEVRPEISDGQGSGH